MSNKLAIARDMAVRRANQSGKTYYVTSFMGRYSVKRNIALGDTLLYTCKPGDVPSLSVCEPVALYPVIPCNHIPGLLRKQAV